MEGVGVRIGVHIEAGAQHLYLVAIGGQYAERPGVIGRDLEIRFPCKGHDALSAFEVRGVFKGRCRIKPYAAAVRELYW